MNLIEWAKRFGVQAGAAVAGVVKPPPPLSADALDELAFRAEVNARAARLRAERAAFWDEVLGGRRWVPRRRGWLR